MTVTHWQSSAVKLGLETSLDRPDHFIRVSFIPAVSSVKHTHNSHTQKEIDRRVGVGGWGGGIPTFRQSHRNTVVVVMMKSSVVVVVYACVSVNQNQLECHRNQRVFLKDTHNID